MSFLGSSHVLVTAVTKCIDKQTETHPSVLEIATARCCSPLRPWSAKGKRPANFSDLASLSIGRPKGGLLEGLGGAGHPRKK
jgi:hypothetical protein